MAIDRGSLELQEQELTPDLASFRLCPAAGTTGGSVRTGGGMALIQQLAKESGIPNLVSGVILHTRLFDTIGEVLVFTLASIGVRQMLEGTGGNASAPSPTFRLGWSVSRWLPWQHWCCGNGLRGHLSPGGDLPLG